MALESASKRKRGEKKPTAPASKKLKLDDERKSAIVPGGIKKPKATKGKKKPEIKKPEVKQEKTSPKKEAGGKGSRGRTQQRTPPTITKTRAQRKAQQDELEKAGAGKDDSDIVEINGEGEGEEHSDGIELAPEMLSPFWS